MEIIHASTAFLCPLFLYLFTISFLFFPLLYKAINACTNYPSFLCMSVVRCRQGLLFFPFVSVMWLKFSTSFDHHGMSEPFCSLVLHFLSAHFTLFLIDLPDIDSHYMAFKLWFQFASLFLHSSAHLTIFVVHFVCGFINVLYLVEIVRMNYVIDARTFNEYDELRWIILPLLSHSLCASFIFCQMRFIAVIVLFCICVHYVSFASLPNDIIGFWLKIKCSSVHVCIWKK